MDVADYKLQTKYKKAYDVFQKVKKYFGMVTGYASAGKKRGLWDARGCFRVQSVN